MTLTRKPSRPILKFSRKIEIPQMMKSLLRKNFWKRLKPISRKLCNNAMAPINPQSGTLSGTPGNIRNLHQPQRKSTKESIKANGMNIGQQIGAPVDGDGEKMSGKLIERLACLAVCASSLVLPSIRSKRSLRRMMKSRVLLIWSRKLMMKLWLNQRIFKVMILNRPTRIKNS